MPSNTELAALAYDVYGQSGGNQILPSGWAEDDSLARSDAITGFGAAVYQNGNDVVISFGGTDVTVTGHSQGGLVR